MKKTRKIWSSVLQSAIRLCLLTSVTFLVTACYAPYYEPDLVPEDLLPQGQQSDSQSPAVPNSDIQE